MPLMSAVGLFLLRECGVEVHRACISSSAPHRTSNSMFEVKFNFISDSTLRFAYRLRARPPRGLRLGIWGRRQIFFSFGDVFCKFFRGSFGVSFDAEFGIDFCHGFLVSFLVFCMGLYSGATDGPKIRVSFWFFFGCKKCPLFCHVFFSIDQVLALAPAPPHCSPELEFLDRV